MSTRTSDLEAFRRALKEGAIPRAYRALTTYMMELRTYYMSRDDAGGVSGLYQGYMDMTYFALFPPDFKRRHLKVSVVFNYEAFRFEVWLSGRNRTVQRRYWALCSEREWPKYRLIEQGTWVDSILEFDVADGLDLAEPEELTRCISERVDTFVADVRKFLMEHDAEPEK